MPDPLIDVQHGGTHYKGMGIQPVEFAYANSYDDCAFSVLKYVTRHRAKAGDLDLQKSIHFVDLRVAMIEKHGTCVATNNINIETYIRANGTLPMEAQILSVLHVWAKGKARNEHEQVRVLKGLIEDLRCLLYLDPPSDFKTNRKADT